MRSFAKWLSVSPAQLSQMMTGKRPITLKSMRKISERLGLSPHERSDLAGSLLQNQNDNDEKQVLRLREDQFHLIADWYHMAILSLTRIKKSQADPRWIAHRLGISVTQAHQALLRLERLGIIQMKPFKQISDPIEMVSEVPSHAIRKYHIQNLNLAIEKIELIETRKRQFQSISIPVNPEKLEPFKKLIDNFLAASMALSHKQDGQEVYNLNVQLFPVTVLKEEK
ncbi:MAG: hypothetical protein A2622_07885 [Bdellovibrionales bacterium RIFCSPHIGHO2_01_FULL_40_29]|nr:MAG: hypothetical protein A2622_07885 [Bdellovibrionales bacterium RIFCSPHIGHO2_01_FULL_40_29]OFZ33726.1 MAG: hypothetical protein A3D17_09975 [Bdellovibrionales bacterium RIFCSPHIGHO2_02_FULL_40_15]